MNKLEGQDKIKMMGINISGIKNKVQVNPFT